MITTSKKDVAVTTTTSSDLQDVRGKLAELAESGRVDELIELVISLLGSAQQSNTALQARLQNALRALYGRKSEKFSADQLSLLFAELGNDAPEAAKQIAEATGEVPQPAKPPPVARGKRGRSALPENLPREIHNVLVADALRRCERCGEEKKSIGHLASEILEFVPAHFKIIEERREKLACAACGDGVVIADSEKVMDRGRPGPALLAHIVVSKFQDSLPLYRQCQIYERAGVSIAQSTMGDWTAFAIEVLEPLATRITGRVLSSFVIGADDTGIRVLDRDDPRGVKKGHIWGYVGDCNLVAFDYTKDWKADGPAKFLRPFRGFMQGDGYAGFDRALRPPDDDDGEEAPVVPENRRLGCGMHIRRKFEAAAQAGDARGAIVLAYFKKLYDVERSCKADDLSAAARKARRAELSMPIVNELFTWIADIHPKLVPGTLLHKATRYAVNQEPFFRRCFDDGRFEIDNGEVERQLRRIAIGRKNYLFAGSDAGADRIATACTILGSAHLNGIDPLAYLTDVIAKLQAGWPMARIDELLPDAWSKSAVAAN
ncbi:MAG: IS66 family transposase [Gemmatimonadota bacterium]|nr:IS66 family transposase [Gemmatimonadota bacterium]